MTRREGGGKTVTNHIGADERVETSRGDGSQTAKDPIRIGDRSQADKRKEVGEHSGWGCTELREL